MKSRSDRLRDARRDAGYSSVKSACDAFGFHYPTYAGHENGSRDFDFDTAERYARAYKVNVTWLMSGKDTPKDEGAEIVRIWDRIPLENRQSALRMLKSLSGNND